MPLAAQRRPRQPTGPTTDGPLNARPAAQSTWTSSPYPAALPSGPPPGFKFPLMAARAKPRHMAASHAAVQVGCMFATGACRGTIVLRSTKPIRVARGSKARVVELGRKAITIAPQTTVAVPVAVPRKLRALVKHLGRVGAVAAVTVHDDAGNTADDTVTLTLTR